MKEQEMQIIKTDSCESLSGKSTLTYQIGSKDGKDINLCLTGNTGKGIFNKDWFDIEETYALLASQKKPITSSSLLGLFEGRSSNTAGFLLAALLREGLLKISPGNRHYNLVSQAEFKKVVQAYTKKKAGKKQVKK